MHSYLNDFQSRLMKILSIALRSQVKKYKLFRFLNDAGKLLLEGHIQDAINVMQESKNWDDFELRYTQKYKLSMQLKCLPSVNN